LNRAAPVALVVAACVTRQFNGLWESLESAGVVTPSDTLYQFWDDLGDNLSVVLVAAALWLAAGSRIWRKAGMFTCLAAAADTLGLWMNPNHYDSWKWELGCAVFSAAVLLLSGYVKRPMHPSTHPPSQKPYRGTGIGFTAKRK